MLERQVVADSIVEVEVEADNTALEKVAAFDKAALRSSLLHFLGYLKRNTSATGENRDPLDLLYMVRRTELQRELSVCCNT